MKREREQDKEKEVGYAQPHTVKKIIKKRATKQNTECYFEFKVSLSCKVHSTDMVQRTLWHSLSQINSSSPGIDSDEE